VAHAIDVPFGRAAIGEGRVTVAPDRRSRDYRDPATELATE
jgi:hypothetical protein